MAAGERSGSSGLSFAQRRSPLLPLLPLSARPALGNEGGAAASCLCVRYRAEPELVKQFPDRLVTWERCRGLIRFVFPKNRVCGLDNAPWVVRLISRQEDKHADVAETWKEPHLQPQSRCTHCLRLGGG